MQDLTTYQYQFIITPLEIISNSKEQNESLSPYKSKQSACTVTNSYAVNHHIKNKSVVIKLGQSIARSNGLNVPMKLETEVLYSKIKNKYSSSKGIIKIYDVFIDDNEVISCVGTFQAQVILEMGPGKHIITKNIGATIIKLSVQAQQVQMRHQQINQKINYMKNLEQKPYKVQKITLDENSRIQSKISIDDSRISFQKSHHENFMNPMIDFSQMRPLQIQSRQIIITQIPPTLATNLQMSLDFQDNDLSQSLSNTISNVKTIQIDSPQKQGDKFYFQNQEKKNKAEGSDLKGHNATSHDFVSQKFQSNDFIDLKSGINFGNSAHTNSGISGTGSKLSAKANHLKRNNQQSSSTVNRNYHKNLNINLNSQTYSQPPSFKNPNSPQSPFSPYTPLRFQSPTNKKQKLGFQINLPKISKLSSLQNADKQLINDGQALGDDVVLQLQSNKSKRGSQQYLQNQSHQFQKVNLNFKNMITQSINLQNSNAKSISSQGQEPVKFESKNPKSNKVDLNKKQVIEKPLSLPNPFTKNSSQACQNQIQDLSMSVASNATSLISNPQLFHQYQKKQLQTLGEQLIEQRHKNIEYEQRIQKLHLKTVTLKQKYLGLVQQWQQWCMYSNKFLDNLHKDQLGCYLLELSKNNEKLSLRYKTTKESQNDFINFLRLTIKNSSTIHTRVQGFKYNDKKLKTLRTQMSDHNTNNSEGFKERLSTEYQNMENGRSQFDKVIQKIQETYTTNNKLKKQNKQLQTKIEKLSIKIQRLENNLIQNKQQQSKLGEQNYELKRQKEYLETQINSLSGINHYLKEKDEQMENIVSLRENTIQNMKKILEKNNEEMDLLEEEYMGFKKKYENKDLILEEMKEQLADKDDLIQVYKELYGEVNRYYKIKDQYLIEEQQHEEQVDEISVRESKKANQKSLIDEIKSEDERKLRISQKNKKQEEIKQIILNVPFINSIDNISQMNKINSYSMHSSDEGNRNRKTSLQESAIREEVKNMEKIKNNEIQNKQFYETMQINKNKQLLASIITGNERIQKLKQEDIRVIRKQITKVINKIEIQAKIISGSTDLFLSLN